MNNAIDTDKQPTLLPRVNQKVRQEEIDDLIVEVLVEAIRKFKKQPSRH